MDFAMSLEMGNVIWSDLGYCSFCCKNFHLNFFFESPDNSNISDEAMPTEARILYLYPPIIRMPFPVGEGIIVDPFSLNGSLGPKMKENINITFLYRIQITIVFHTSYPFSIHCQGR